MSDEKDKNAISGEIILYQTEDGRSRIQLRAVEGTVWLTQREMAELFSVSTDNISLHLKNIYRDEELNHEATTEESSVVRMEGSRQVSRIVTFYNLEAILAVGYRVRSPRGIQFRKWANTVLIEYLTKGFAMDDERLMNPPGPGQVDYFDELLDRIRNIRTSERRFYQKVLDIYATSVDYSPNTAVSKRFFATVQNKLHWAMHGHTAAELIHQRVDASTPHMGLKTTRPGGRIRKADVSIAKNYLDENELEGFNLLVNAYLDFAELQARNRRVMTMEAWITKLDEFLSLSDYELLHHAGKISANDAKNKAESEYAKYLALQDAKPRAVDTDFEQAVQRLSNAKKKDPK